MKPFISCCLSLFILSTLAFASEPVWTGLPYPDDNGRFSIENFSYRMRGSIKLLILWIGKDDVGGGTISRIKGADGTASALIDGYSVLFGSDPGAVPGNHNRWGYARELAYWNPKNSPEPLAKTVFEGFMSKSSEESMNEIRQEDKEKDESGSALFEGSSGVVTPLQASMNLWRFDAASQATYRNPEIISSRYLEVARLNNPDIERVLENKPSRFDQPAGFFTAIRLLLDPILQGINSGDSISQFKNASQKYVNSAHLYTLKIAKLKLHKEYELNGIGFRDVLQLDFQTLRHDLGRKHDFSLWIPTSGAYRGIPIRIADKPRWWLKVELTIDQGK